MSRTEGGTVSNVCGPTSTLRSKGDRGGGRQGGAVTKTMETDRCGPEEGWDDRGFVL